VGLRLAEEPWAIHAASYRRVHRTSSPRR